MVVSLVSTQWVSVQIRLDAPKTINTYMRIKEIITEYKASPNVLISIASKIPAKVGIEFEMCVQDIISKSDTTEERDDDADIRCESIDQIVEFFDYVNYNSTYILDRFKTKLTNSFDIWWSETCDDDWNNYGKRNAINEFLSIIDSDDKDQIEEDLYNEKGSSYDEIKQEWLDDRADDQESNEADWLNYEGLLWMSDVEQQYDIDWPYYNEISGEDELDLEYITDSFSEAVRPVSFSSSEYHGAKRSTSGYSVETDASITVDSESDAGLEFISPPLSFQDMISDLHRVKTWANTQGCYTNDSTGLHINVSLPNYNVSKLDYVKLVLMLGDNYILDEFGRGANSFCKPALGTIGAKLGTDSEILNQYLNNMKHKLNGWAIRIISGIFNKTEKYTSVNIKDGYIEFRSPGGIGLIPILQN